MFSVSEDVDHFIADKHVMVKIKFQIFKSFFFRLFDHFLDKKRVERCKRIFYDLKYELIGLYQN